jgi:predicted nucleotidyltransferase
MKTIISSYFKIIISTALAQNMRQNHSLKKRAIGRNVQTETRKSFFSERILNIWNELPKEIAEVTNINLFKSRLKEFDLGSLKSVKFDVVN